MKKKKEKISEETTLGEIVSSYPQAAPVLAAYGFHCVGCHFAAWETIEQGASAHGLGKKQLKELLAELNKAAGEKK